MKNVQRRAFRPGERGATQGRMGAVIVVFAVVCDLASCAAPTLGPRRPDGFDRDGEAADAPVASPLPDADEPDPSLQISDAGADASKTEVSQTDAARPDRMGFDGAVSEADARHIVAACSNAGAFGLCEDFESGTINPAIWSTSSGGGALIEIVRDRAHRGTASLHVRTQQKAGSRASLSTRRYAGTNKTLFGRMFARFGASPRNIHGVLVNAGSPGGGVYRYATQLGKYMLSIGGANLDWGRRSQANVPVGQWICLEWEWHPSEGVARMWADGNELNEIEPGNADRPKLTFPAFDTVHIGWGIIWHDDPDPQFDVWLDDLILDGKRVGCG